MTYTAEFEDIRARLGLMDKKLDQLLSGTTPVPPAQDGFIDFNGDKYRLLSNSMSEHKLTKYYPNSEGKPTEIFPPELLTHSEVFYEDKDGVIKIGCPYFGAKTSSNTKSTRHEARGLIEFDYTENVAIINKYSLDEIHGVKRKVVTQQMHDNKEPIFKRTNYLSGGKLECYQLVNPTDGYSGDVRIDMGVYDVGEVIVAKAFYNGQKNKMFFQDNDGEVKSIDMNRTGKGGKIYKKFLLYPQYITNDENNHKNDVCKATFWI